MITVPSSRSTRAPLLVDLALQGGGSHGAFTWGVLDRLLEEPWLRIEGISGTSAGAMNAAVLVDGHAEGGADGARARLELFWKRVSDGARFSPFRRSPLDILLGRWTLDTSPLFLAFDLMARVFSPYDLNPRGVNPLTAILADCIDFKRVARAPIKLFMTAPMCAQAADGSSAMLSSRRTSCFVGLPANDVSDGRASGGDPVDALGCSRQDRHRGRIFDLVGLTHRHEETRTLLAQVRRSIARDRR